MNNAVDQVAAVPIAFDYPNEPLHGTATGIPGANDSVPGAAVITGAGDAQPASTDPTNHSGGPVRGNQPTANARAVKAESEDDDNISVTKTLNGDECRMEMFTPQELSESSESSRDEDSSEDEDSRPLARSSKRTRKRWVEDDDSSDASELYVLIEYFVSITDQFSVSEARSSRSRRRTEVKVEVPSSDEGKSPDDAYHSEDDEESLPSDNEEDRIKTEGGLREPQGFRRFKGFKGLMPHQLTGIEWMVEREKDARCRGGILADEPGLGKTLTVTGHLLHVKQHVDGDETNIPLPAGECNASLSSWSFTIVAGVQRARGALVVVPTVVVHQWYHQITKKFLRPDALKVCLYYGTERHRIPTQT